MIEAAATTPLISLPAFMIGLIAVLLIARGAVDIYIYYSEQKKSPQDCANNPAGERLTREHYNRKREGA